MAPSSENNPAIVPDEASTGEMISGLPLSGQPGKAVGHAVGKLTLRHDLAAAGATATPQAPLAWLRLEPHPHSYIPAELRLTLWNGRTGEPEHRLLATTDFHGGTLHWFPEQHR